MRVRAGAGAGPMVISGRTEGHACRDRWRTGRELKAEQSAQISSGTISMAPAGHSVAHKPQPLQ